MDTLHHDVVWGRLQPEEPTHSPLRVEQPQTSTVVRSRSGRNSDLANSRWAFHSGPLEAKMPLPNSSCKHSKG
jgi:hypothetical protein